MHVRFSLFTLLLAFATLPFPMMRVMAGSAYPPSERCPQAEVPISRDPSRRIATPVLRRANEVEDTQSRVVVLTNSRTPSSLMPAAVLVLRDDHLLVFSRAVFDLGAPLKSTHEVDPRLSEYYAVQLSEIQVIDFYLSCWAEDLYDDVGTETTLTGQNWSHIILSDGDSRSRITSVHLGYSEGVYVSPSRGVISLPPGETQESMLAQEDAGYKRSREAWDQALTRILALVPEDESEWQPLPDLKYTSFRYGICPPSEP